MGVARRGAALGGARAGRPRHQNQPLPPAGSRRPPSWMWGTRGLSPSLGALLCLGIRLSCSSYPCSGCMPHLCRGHPVGSDPQAAPPHLTPSFCGYPTTGHPPVISGGCPLTPRKGQVGPCHLLGYCLRLCARGVGGDVPPLHTAASVAHRKLSGFGLSDGTGQRAAGRRLVQSMMLWGCEQALLS